MRQKKLFVLFLSALFMMAGWVRWVPAASMDEMVAAAKKEGSIDFYFVGVLSPKGAQTIAKAFNKKYGLNIKLNFSPSGGVGRDVGKLMTMAATGVPPEWDVMVMPDVFHGRLAARKLQEKIDYAKLGVDPKAVHYRNSSVDVYSAFALPAYNTKLVAPKDAPKNWEDMLDPNTLVSEHRPSSV